MDDRLAADARLRPFSGRVAFYIAGLSACVSLTFVAMIVIVSFILTSDPGTPAMRVDFGVFWAAGKLALAGEPLAVHDLARLSAAHATPVDAYLPWLYPPGYLFLVTPFGALSFSMAFTIWTLLSIVLTAWAFQPFVATSRPLWVLVALAPAYYPAVLLGQNSLFWMAGLLAGLAALREGRWVMAGILIGFLTLKPQLGVMIPFALLAIGAWRTILVAIATMVVLLILPTLVYGLEYWPLLHLSLAEHGERLIYSVGDILLMISPAFTLAFFGVPENVAWATHWVLAAGCSLAVLLIWRSDRVGFDVKAAALLCAIMLSAPYLWYYEGVLLVAIGLFLLRGGVLSLRPLSVILLFLLWLGCALQSFNTLLALFDPRWLGAAYIPPLVLFCLGLCLRQALSRPALVSRAA